MGRLFDTKETNKTSSTPSASKGRLFTSKLPPKPTLGEKVTKVAVKVNDFVGGKALSEKIGAKIAKAGAAPDEKQYITEPTNKQALASAGEVALNIAGLIPGIGVAAKAATLGKVRYGALALEGAAYGGGQAALRGVQDQKSGKEILKDTVIGTGIGAVAGPLIGRMFKGKVPKTLPEKEITDVVDTTLPKALTPSEKQAVYSSKMGYEPYTPTEQLPTIETGTVPKSDLPVVQVGEKTPKKLGSYTYEPIKEPVAPTFSAETGEAVYNTNIPETKPVSTSQRLPSTKGNTVTSEARSINESFVKQGFDELEPDEMAKYVGFNEADQIARVTAYMDNPQFIDDIVAGRVPKDVVPQVAYNAVKNKAIADADFETQRLLAKSPIATQKSQAASTLRASQVLQNPGDPVEIMANLNSDLRKATEKKLGKTVEVAQQELIEQGEQHFKKEVTKKVTKQSFSEFINSISC